jgi:hypothetical protein
LRPFMSNHAPQLKRQESDVGLFQKKGAVAH